MVASKPSISGMWQSIRMRSKLRVRIQRFPAVVRDGHAVALDLQDAERDLLVDQVVFHHQDMAADSGRARAVGADSAGAASASWGRPAITFTRHS